MTRTARHRLEPVRRSWRTRASTGLVALGVLTLGGSATGIVAAHAAGAPGSNFGNVDINVTATGLRSPFYSHSGEDVEGEAPYAFASLQSGGTGTALTSVFWPGGTGGNGGSTLKLLAGGCVPPNPGNTVPIPVPVPLPPLPCVYHTPTLPDPVYQNLNDSYKAEVQSSDNKTTVKKSNPGVDMVATANAKETSATTVMAGAKLPGDTFGTTTTSSVIKLTGANKAVIDAVSVMRNLSIGGKALTIDSVKSVAHATTDGKKATGTTSTVVNGMKIAGTPVTVDNKGVHIQGQGSKLPSLDALNTALKKAGVSVYVADPSKKVKGASVNLFSGQLVVMQDNPQYTSNANDTAIVMSFGGASIAADTNRAFQFSPLPPTIVPPAAPSASTPNTPSVSVPGSSGSVPSSPTVAGEQPQGQSPVLAAAENKLPGGIAAGWVVLALLGSGLIAAGLKRLPDRVLAASGGACTLGSDT